MRIFTLCLIAGIITTAFTAEQKGITYGLPLSFDQTVDSINSFFKKHSNYGHQIAANRNGQALLTTRNDRFNFNFMYLENSGVPAGYEVNGIEMIYADEKTRAVHSWIYFNSFKGHEAFIKLDNIGKDELATLHRLFIHLHNLCLQRLFTMNG
jgi:hypothetical protein